METTEKLFSEFEKATKDQWKNKAIEDLKGADFDKKLVWKSDDNFSVQPFYTPEDVENDETLKTQHNLFAGMQRSWTNYVEIKADDPAAANAMALEMKKFGASGFLFKLENHNPDLKKLLNGLELAKDSISFSSAAPSPAFISSYFSFIKENKISLSDVRGFYEADILETWITTGAEPDFKALAEVIKQTSASPLFKGLTVRSHAFINSGSNTTQELAFVLNKLTDYIEKLSEHGVKASEVVDETMFHLAIGGDYFFEIAKLRSFRILLANIINLYNADASKVKIISSNSLWSKSLYDPYVNMLRNTTEAMSALIGGCDALLSYPHDYSFKEPTKFSQRIALNISNILKEESYLDKVTDPSGGSYYLENLTRAITDGSLELFKETESKGGFVSAFNAGVVQEKIKAVRDKKEKEIASRRRVYVGTNKYPNLQERISFTEEEKASSSNGLQLLVPQRVTKSFEDLRNRTQAHLDKTGFIPKVYLACFGNLAMRKARATFASEFFGTAGFEVLGEFFFDDPQKAAEDSAKSNADIVVICSSDQEYETQAAPFAEKFKSIGKGKFLVLAGYPEAIVEALKAAGVDNFIHVKSNAIEVLSDFQNKLIG